MLQEIIDNFEKECESAPDNMTLRVICNHVVENLQGADDDILKNITEKKLTLQGAVNKMRDKASKIRQNNCAVLTQEEGFDIVDKYFGITAAEKKSASLFDFI